MRPRTLRLATATGILLAAALWLLLIHFPHHSLWYDEALTTYLSLHSLETLWAWCTQVDIQVPAHYLALRGWASLLGQSEFALRLLSAFSILLAVAALMATGRWLRQRGVGYAAATFLAFFPGTLWLAYEVRAYALGIALYAWTTALLMLIITRPAKPFRWLPDRVVLGYVLLMLATLYTHYTGIGAFASQLAILVGVAAIQRSGKLFRTAVAIGILVGIGFMPWLPVVLSRSAADRSYYTGQPILPTRSTAVMLSFQLTGREDLPDLMPALLVGYTVVLGIGVAVGLSHRASWRTAFSGVMLILFPVAIAALTVYFRPKLAGRYAWAAWGGSALLLGIVAARVGQWRRPAGVILTAALIAIPWIVVERGRPPRSDFREAFAYLCAQGTPQDVIILRDGTLFPLQAYYGSRPPCDIPRYAVGLPMALITNVEQALTTPTAYTALQQIAALRPPNVWVVAWQGDVLDPQGLALGLLDLNARHTLQAASFGDVTLDRYEGLAESIAPAPNAATPIYTAPENGPLLYATRLLVNAPARAGDLVVVQAWWQRGGTLAPDLRVGAQITTLDGGWTYVQLDQPPSGWTYLDDRWDAATPVLGRYALRLGADVPSGQVLARLIIYDAVNRWPPVIIPLGAIMVQQ